MVTAPSMPAEDAPAAISLCGGLPERVTRLTLRLVLTALRCAPPSVASDCVQSACRLLPMLLDAPSSATAPGRCSCHPFLPNTPSAPSWLLRSTPCLAVFFNVGHMLHIPLGGLTSNHLMRAEVLA